MRTKLPLLPFADQLALAKFEADPDARSHVAPGDYESESVRLSLTYRIRVGEPCEAVIAAAIPWQRLALLALDRLNPATRAAVVDAALAAEAPTALDLSGLKADTQARADALLGSTRATRAGAVRGEVWIRPG